MEIEWLGLYPSWNPDFDKLFQCGAATGIQAASIPYIPNHTSLYDGIVYNQN